VKRFHFPSVLIPAVLCLAPSAALQAGPLVLPDLAPGSPYRLVFVTSVGYTGYLKSGSDFSGFVNDLANNLNGNSGSLLAPMNASWIAIASAYHYQMGLVRSAAGSVGTFTEPIYTDDGSLVAIGSAGLWSGSLLSPIDWTERGTLSVGSTGCGFYGECGDVYTGSDSSGQYLAGYGNSRSKAGWAHTDYQGFQSPSMYGLSEVLYIPIPNTSTPEPGTQFTTLGGVLLLVLAAVRSRRNRHMHG
jgi:hypothetical protein